MCRGSKRNLKKCFLGGGGGEGEGLKPKQYAI